GRHDAVFHDGLEFGQRLDAGFGPHAFVALDLHRLALALGNIDRYHLLSELALFPSGRGALLAARREGVGLLARDLVVARQVLGRFDHAADASEALLGLLPLAPALQAVVQRHRTGALAPTHVGRV